MKSYHKSVEAEINEQINKKIKKTGKSIIWKLDKQKSIIWPQLFSGKF